MNGPTDFPDGDRPGITAAVVAGPCGARSRTMPGFFRTAVFSFFLFFFAAPGNRLPSDALRRYGARTRTVQASGRTLFFSLTRTAVRPVASGVYTRTLFRRPSGAFQRRNGPTRTIAKRSKAPGQTLRLPGRACAEAASFSPERCRPARAVVGGGTFSIHPGPYASLLLNKL